MHKLCPQVGYTEIVNYPKPENHDPDLAFVFYIYSNMKSIALFLLSFCLLPKADSLRSKIEQITRKSKGVVGVSVIHLEKKDTFTLNGNLRLPMQSVFKLPLA